MTVMPSAAAAAYQALSKIGGNLSSGTGSTSVTGAPNFGDFLSGAMKDTMGALKGGEQAAMKQVAGKADVVDVVNAVNNAEMTLDTVVAVRDKVIGAYQDIMRMPI